MVSAPGRVSNIEWNGTARSVLLEWDAPKKNPQCVEKYLVAWKDQQNYTTETHIILDGLHPCSNFPVIVSSNSLPKSRKLHEHLMPVLVSTDRVGKGTFR